jgi:hypothetical protein
MRVWIRNLTKDIDTEIVLPMTEEELDKRLNPNDEYIIIDYDAKVLSPGQYDSIDKLNEFLLECKENWIDEEMLGVLSRVLLYNEVIEHVRKGKYIIVDFDAETSHWNCGRGGDFHSDSDKGRLLHDLMLYRFDWEKKFPIAEEMEDDIEWENLWTNASCSGWHEVRFNNCCYLVYTR